MKRRPETPKALIYGALALALSAFAQGADAQTLDQQWAYCENRGDAYALDLQIGGCTGIIQSGQETQENLAIAFYNRGIAYNRQGDRARAIADYDQSIRLNPQFASAYRNRGLAYQNSAPPNYQQAIADANSAERLAPQDWGPPSDRADVYLALGNYQQAISDYTRSIALDPTQEWNFSHRAQAYQALGDTARAEADRRESARLGGGQ
nr:tetratricopeptide repeat protein [Nitrosomonas nitrosa]